MMRVTSDLAAPPSDYPVRPVTLVEPFGAGGGPDIIARAMANELSRLWHEPVSVHNHPGGGGAAAPLLVANAAPDGYTLLVNTSAHAYSAEVLSDVPYDPLHDFIPVAALTSQPYVVVAGRPAAIKTLGELVHAARDRPGELTFATTGVGTGTHTGIAELNLTLAISATHIPPSRGDAISDVVAGVIRGETDYMMSPISIVQSHLRDGELIPLGVTTTTRSALLPDVPTLDETGAPGYDFPIWYGLWAPASTPTAIIDKLNADISISLSAPDVARQLAREGAQPISMRQQRFAQYVRDESQRASDTMNRTSINEPNGIS